MYSTLALMFYFTPYFTHSSSNLHNVHCCYVDCFSLSRSSLYMKCTGPLAPAVPAGVTYTSTAYTTATLQWTVPYITYTPETYTIQFGIDASLLDQTSASIAGNTDITAENELFSIQLTELVHDTTYYYRVVASNINSSSASDVDTFVTVPLRKYYRNAYMVRSVLSI